MNKKTRMIAAWLCTLLLVPTAASCADADQSQTKQPTDTTAAKKESVEDQTTTPLQNAIAKLGERDYGGYVFRILDRSEEDPNWFTIDVYAESENGVQ